MKKTRNMLLGTAAAALALTGVAQAADAPAPAYKDRTPVWACDITGFWELPGTDLCFKVGGYVKADYIVTTDDSYAPAQANEAWSGFVLGGIENVAEDGEEPDFQRIVGQDQVRFHAFQTRLNFDVRNNTEYGVVRAFIEGDFWTDSSATGGQSGSPGSGDRFRLRHAFVQFGNLLAGQTWSTFTGVAGGEDTSFDDNTGIEYMRNAQIRYTQPFGDGVSVAIALEDPKPSLGGSFVSPLATGLTAVEGSGDKLPDLVLALQVSQTWGTVKLAGMIRQLSVRALDTNGVLQDEDEFGWAVGLSGSFNIPILGHSDVLTFDAAYGEGANRYIGSFETPDLIQGFNDAGATDGAELVTTWGASLSYTHYWTSTVRSTVKGMYNVASVDTGPNSDVEIDSLRVAGNIFWSPVPRLDLGLEVMYWREEIKTTANGVDDIKFDDDIVRVQATVKRSF